MKKFVYAILTFIGFVNYTNAQLLNNKCLEIIIDISKDRRDLQNPFIYSKGINPYEVIEMINSLQRIDTQKLSINEKKFIADELLKQSDTCFWNNLNIPNSLVISKDTIASFMKHYYSLWNNNKKFYGNSFYNFTIPILFRDNQFCAFYYGYSSGPRDGTGLLAIYKRENNKWKILYSIYEWYS